MWTGQGRQSISCVYTQVRGARQVCAVSPQATGFYLTQIGSTLFTVSLIFLSIWFPLCTAAGLNTCLCCRAQCDVGSPSVQSWGFWLMDGFPSGHGILPFCVITLTCAASEERRKNLDRKVLKSEGDCFDLAGSLSVSLFRFSCSPFLKLYTIAGIINTSTAMCSLYSTSQSAKWHFPSNISHMMQASTLIRC